MRYRLCKKCLQERKIDSYCIHASHGEINYSLPTPAEPMVLTPELIVTVEADSLEEARAVVKSGWRTDLPPVDTHDLEGVLTDGTVVRNLWRGRYGWWNEHTPITGDELLHWRYCDPVPKVL